MFENLKRRLREGEVDASFFFEVVAAIRPASRFRIGIAVEKMDDLLNELEKDAGFCTAFSGYIRQLFEKRRFKITLCETGIIGERGFAAELGKRISYKILPYQPSDDTLDYLLTNSLYKSWDHNWVLKIREDQWTRLFALTGIHLFPNTGNASFSFTHLLFTIQILAQQSSAAGMSSEFLRMVPEYQNLDSPFLSLQKELDLLTGALLSEEAEEQGKLTEHFGQLKVFIAQSRELTLRARKNKERFGISFSTTMRILRLDQQLGRLEFLILFMERRLTANDPENEAGFIRRLVEYHSGKNRILSYIKETSHLVAYQATQHTGKTGEKYITSSRKEYNRMFFSAAGAGFIIGFMCLIKLFLSGAETSPFGHAIYYSLNYSIGFLLIYFLHFTVATKQPAMTAAALAQSLESSDKGHDHYDNFTSLFARLFRSQFVAFCGNVFFSFPTALLVTWVVCYYAGENIIPPLKTEKLLREIDPLRSPAFFHAGIAGFHLFFSGLLSGYVINKSIHHQVAFRIQQHPMLVPILSETHRKRIAGWYDRHIGGLTSNVSLGVLLGSTAIVGMFFGLNWDIRHITFVSGNLGISAVGRDFQLSVYEIAISVLGIGGIGFFNFLISFTFSLLLAMRARNIPLKELLNIGKAIFNRFVYSPSEFFTPPR